MTVAFVAGDFRKSLSDFWSYARKSPEAIVLLLISAAGAVWAVHSGPFPGTGLMRQWPLLVSTVAVVVWLSLFVVLALAYLSVLERRTPRNLLRSLAICFVLIIASSSLPTLTIAPIYRDVIYTTKYPYLIFCTGLWIVLLLGHETEALWLKVQGKPRLGTPLIFTTIVGAAALAVLGMETITCLLIGRQWSISLAGFLVNALILASLFVLVFAFTSRIQVTILFVCTVYIGFGLANIAKISYMHAAVQPLDLLYVPEFMPQFHSTFGITPALAFVLASVPYVAGILLILKSRPRQMPIVHRALAGLVSILLLLAVTASIASNVGGQLLKRAGIQSIEWDSVRSAGRNGYLVEFAIHLSDLFVTMPSNYSEQAVTRIVDRYSANMVPSGQLSPHGRVNLVVYLVESLMDPADLGLHFTSEPMPTIRSLSAISTSGYAIVPGSFGRSANSEFEILTGMAMFFLSRDATPYKQYIKRNLPSMPCFLKQLGYRTVAVHADTKSTYNRQEVYRHLCFDDTVWLYQDPQVLRDVTGRRVSDDAVVDIVIQNIEANAEHKPLFIFAFTDSTHHPYNHDVYRESDLDVVDPVAGRARDEVKFYVNAVRAADRAIGRLIEYVKGRPEKTIVVVLGDHLPPLSAGALLHFYDDTKGGSSVAARRKEHKVPLLIWSNVLSTRDNVEMSLNALPPYLLKRMGIEPRGFLGFVNAMQSQLPVLSSFVQDATGSQWLPDAVPDRYQELIRDYELLQYDILLGKRYSLRSGGD